MTARNRSSLTAYIVVCLIGATLFFLVGCASDEHSRYRVLSFFFDGVPKPGETEKSASPAPSKTPSAKQSEKVAPAAAGSTRFTHPPAEGKDGCSYCHGSTKSFVLPRKDMCLKCHQHLKDRRLRLVMHGPALVDCMACHNPHEGQTRELLKKTGDALCYDCHERESSRITSAHNKIQTDQRPCLFCHDPHGGKDRFFLRERSTL